MDLQYTLTVDGAWTDWSQWGSCSKTCGGGRRSRARTCDNPKPANGGKECVGDSGDFGDCNIDDCPTVPAGTYQQVAIYIVAKYKTKNWIKLNKQ